MEIILLEMRSSDSKLRDSFTLSARTENSKSALTHHDTKPSSMETSQNHSDNHTFNFEWTPPTLDSCIQISDNPPKLSNSDSTTEQEPKDPNFEKRVYYARFMRAQFSPKTSCNPDYTLNQDYFRPSRATIIEALRMENSKKWTNHHKNQLLKGIEKHGIGSWVEIIRDFLPGQQAHNLRMKTARLIGRQSVRVYKGWRGTPDDVLKERNFNYKLGMELGGWKAGYLVLDDAGLIEARLKELRPNGPKSPIGPDGVRR